jgi:ubiquinone/menaquinone biosynthesis C-methylase UbiE
MNNPWLRIPVSDYEAHMALPEVAQAQALNDLMASALANYTPASLAVIGCTTGNGFEHIDTMQTRRVVGIDINPDYLAVLRSRFASVIPDLKLIEADISAQDFWFDPVSMIFAGLVFEYVDVTSALRSIAGCMLDGSILVAVLQLPSPTSAHVTTTRYKSLQLLSPIMKLISCSDFSIRCDKVGLKQIKADTIPLKKGKAFWVGYFRKFTQPGTPTTDSIP